MTGAASLNVLKTGDTMTGSLTISGASSNLSVGGTLGVTGNTTLTANLIVDTDTLYVQSTDNLVGIGKVPVTTSTQNSKLQVFSGALGTTVGNATYIASFESSSGNYSRLVFWQRRHTAGSDWTTTSTRIQQRIDVTDQGYIEFNPSGSLQGIALGSGSTEALRVISTGEIGIRKTPQSGYALDIEGKARVSTGFEIDNTADNSGAPLFFFGSSTTRNFRIGNQLAVSNSFEITPSTTNGGATFTTPGLLMSGSGNVGIGVASVNDTYKLEVAGSINFTGTLFQNGVAYVTSRWTAAPNGNDIYRNSNVGVGITSNPAYKLEVGGTVGMTGILHANGDKQWLDTYGVFKANRNTISENVTIPTNTNAMTAGPVTINNTYTITIQDGASWSIV